MTPTAFTDSTASKGAIFMADANYRGVSAEQDGRYRDKETLLLKKLAKDGQFPVHFDERVDMSKVNLEVMRPWIAERVESLLGFEDDVVVEYASSLLDGSPDPRKMQLNLTGFLEKSTPTFMSELWTLLLSAQKSIGGIPQEFVDKKKEEMRAAREHDAQAIASTGASRREPHRSQWQPGPRDSGYQRRGQPSYNAYTRESDGRGDYRDERRMRDRRDDDRDERGGRERRDDYRDERDRRHRRDAYHDDRDRHERYPHSDRHSRYPDDDQDSRHSRRRDDRSRSRDHDIRERSPRGGRDEHKRDKNDRGAIDEESTHKRRPRSRWDEPSRD